MRGMISIATKLEVEQIFIDLLKRNKICFINGQNMANLLKTESNFRHFLCHEVDMEQAKNLFIEKLLNSAELNKLEDEFPEIMRIGGQKLFLKF